MFAELARGNSPLLWTRKKERDELVEEEEEEEEENHTNHMNAHITWVTESREVSRSS